MINKSKIKKLAQVSYRNASLDETKVKKISKLLKREELKDYIKFLKHEENKKTITLVVPDEKLDSLPLVAQKLKRIYPDKRIIVRVDESLIAGIRIINDDLIYEVSIKQMLEDLLQKI